MTPSPASPSNFLSLFPRIPFLDPPRSRTSRSFTHLPARSRSPHLLPNHANSTFIAISHQCDTTLPFLSFPPHLLACFTHFHYSKTSILSFLASLSFSHSHHWKIPTLYSIGPLSSPYPHSLSSTHKPDPSITLHSTTIPFNPLLLAYYTRTIIVPSHPPLPVSMPTLTTFV